MLVKYKSNNNTIKAVEKKYGGRVDVIKGKNVWGDAIELGEYEQIRKLEQLRKSQLRKNKTKQLKKTVVTFKNFEVFKNIETIKQNIIRNRRAGQGLGL